MRWNTLPQKLIGPEEERAVSPVIGVILMVAITVILAAVIAAFVLDIGPGEPEPNAVVEVDSDGDGYELVSLDNADAVVPVDDGGEYAGGDNDILTTAGETGDLDGADNIQAVRVDGDPTGISSSEDIEDETDANAIVENLD